MIHGGQDTRGQSRTDRRESRPCSSPCGTPTRSASTSRRGRQSRLSFPPPPLSRSNRRRKHRRLCSLSRPGHLSADGGERRVLARAVWRHRRRMHSLAGAAAVPAAAAAMPSPTPSRRRKKKRGGSAQCRVRPAALHLRPAHDSCMQALRRRGRGCAGV